VKPPHYYKPAYKPEVLIAHFRRVADESPIPVMLYSIPQFTGITLGAAEVAALAEHPTSSHKRQLWKCTGHRGFCRCDATRVQRFGGQCRDSLSLVRRRRAGGILALASALPEKCVKLFELIRQGIMKKLANCNRWSPARQN